MANLEEIKAPIIHELEEFEIYFQKSMETNVALLNKIMYYIVQRKGKQIRPIFVLLCAKMVQPKITKKSFVAASLIELIHTATLVHDDVVDDSLERRGFFSLNALWKNKIAVLVGDFLFSKGLLLSVNNNSYDILRIVSLASQKMIEGELLQLEKARKLDIKEDVYYNIIRQKTASLMGAACAAGVSSASDDEEIIERGRLFGEKVGMAFQIKDDLFDFGTADVGKPLGIDIKEKKMTLPLIYALNNTNKTTKRKILNNIKKHNEDKNKVAEVIEFVRNSGGLVYATKIMNQYRNEANVILDSFPNVESRESLRKLVAFVTERNR